MVIRQTLIKERPPAIATNLIKSLRWRGRCHGWNYKFQVILCVLIWTTRNGHVYCGPCDSFISAKLENHLVESIFESLCSWNYFHSNKRRKAPNTSEILAIRNELIVNRENGLSLILVWNFTFHNDISHSLEVWNPVCGPVWGNLVKSICTILTRTTWTRPQNIFKLIASIATVFRLAVASMNGVPSLPAITGRFLLVSYFIWWHKHTAYIDWWCSINCVLANGAATRSICPDKGVGCISLSLSLCALCYVRLFRIRWTCSAVGVTSCWIVCNECFSFGAESVLSWFSSSIERYSPCCVCGTLVEPPADG